MSDLKNALSALTQRKVKVENYVDGIYVRPLPQRVNFELLAQEEGETDLERNRNYNIATLHYCLVDEQGELVYEDLEEFREWYLDSDYSVIEPLLIAVRKLNDFSSLEEEVKKK